MQVYIFWMTPSLIKIEKIVSYKVNVLYIVDQAHQRCVIVKKFSRQLTHNPWITTPKTKQRLSPISGKRKGKSLFENLKKRKKLKKLVKQKKQSSNYNESRQSSARRRYVFTRAHNHSQNM